MRRSASWCLFACLLVAADVWADQRPMTFKDLAAFQRVADPQISPDGRHVAYQVTTVDLDGNKTSTNIWVAALDRKTPPRRLTTSTKADRHPRWSPDGSRILFESTRSGEGQLWVIDVGGGEARQVTSLSTGASNGIWAPDGRTVAFVSAVYPEYSDKPFSESDKLNKERSEKAEKGSVKAKVFTRLFFRHWDEYVEDKRQHLFVVNADGGEPLDVTPGDRDAYPTSTTFSVGDDFTFSPDGTHLVFTAVPSRDEAWSTNYDVCRVSVKGGGKVQMLTKGNAAGDGSPRFSPDGKKLAWRAQKRAGYEADKWDILVADCKPDGSVEGEPKNVTSGKDVSVNEFVWLADSKTLMFPTDDNGGTTVWETRVDDPAVEKFTKGGQLSSFSVSRDGNRLAFQRAAMNHPPHVAVMGTARASENPPIQFDPNEKRLAEIDRPRPESVTVPVEGDVKMQMWVLKPPGFDESKKWPVAYLVHGGPQGAWEDGWSNRWNPELWAAQGYVVVLPNPRGSTGFGQRFVDEISGDWGGKCYRDLVKGLDYVEKLPYVDKDRIGAAGASFGGYMMDWFAVNDIAPRFKCIISHCSVWDFESMWGTTDELWFDEWEHQGLPWQKPESYAEFSPHKKAGNLGKYKTPMLVIQNDLDFRCPVGQGIELFTALQRQKVASRFINFPDEGHWVLKPKNSEYWHQEVFAWLKKYCPPGGK